MPIFSGDVTVRPDMGITSLKAGYGEMLGTEAESAWDMSPTKELIDIDELARAQEKPEPVEGAITRSIAAAPAGPSALFGASALLYKRAAERLGGYDRNLPPTPDIPIAEARQRVKDSGLDSILHLPEQPTVKEAALDIMLNRARVRQERETTLARGPQGFIPGALSLGTSLLVGAADPLNVAAGFIPVVGEARYAKLMASAGERALARFGVRAGVGATQGVAFSAAMQPLTWYGRTQEGQDYTMAEALHSVVMGGLLFGAMHSVGGGAADLWRWRQGRPLYPFDFREPHDVFPGYDTLRAPQAEPRRLATEPFGERGAAAPELPERFPGLDEPFGPVSVVKPAAPEVQPYVTPSAIASIEGSPQPGLSRLQAAQTGVPYIDAIVNSEPTRSVIENPVVDRSHTIPYTAGGSVPMRDPTMYVDHRFPTAFTVARLSDPGKSVTFDPAEPLTIHENVEQHVMEALIAGGMPHEIAYRVAHFGFAEKAEGAWYRAHDIDQAAAEAAYQPHMDRIQREGADSVPANLYKDPYPHDRPGAARHETLNEPGPSPAELQRALEILQAAREPAPAHGMSPNAARQTVHEDIANKLRADRPDWIGEHEIDAYAALVAENFAAWADRLGGKETALDLYREEGLEVRRPQASAAASTALTTGVEKGDAALARLDAVAGLGGDLTAARSAPPVIKSAGDFVSAVAALKERFAKTKERSIPLGEDVVEAEVLPPKSLEQGERPGFLDSEFDTREGAETLASVPEKVSGDNSPLRQVGVDVKTFRENAQALLDVAAQHEQVDFPIAAKEREALENAMSDIIELLDEHAQSGYSLVERLEKLSDDLYGRIDKLEDDLIRLRDEAESLRDEIISNQDELFEEHLDYFEKRGAEEDAAFDAAVARGEDPLKLPARVEPEPYPAHFTLLDILLHEHDQLETTLKRAKESAAVKKILEVSPSEVDEVTAWNLHDAVEEDFSAIASAHHAAEAWLDRTSNFKDNVRGLLDSVTEDVVRPILDEIEQTSESLNDRLLEEPTRSFEQSQSGASAIRSALNQIGERGNKWVDLPEGRIYLRASRRPEIGRTLEIPNVDFDEEARGQGAFRRYLTQLEQEASARGFDAVYVEQLFNKRLEQFLRRRGYRDEPNPLAGLIGGDQATLYKPVAPRSFDQSGKRSTEFGFKALQGAREEAEQAGIGRMIDAESQRIGLNTYEGRLLHSVNSGSFDKPSLRMKPQEFLESEYLWSMADRMVREMSAPREQGIAAPESGLSSLFGEISRDVEKFERPRKTWKGSVPTMAEAYAHLANYVFDKAGLKDWHITPDQAEAEMAGQHTQVLLDRLARRDLPRSFDQSQARAPTFFSAVSRTIDEAKQEKAPAAQWLGMLKNKPGVKAEELEWLGVEEWLKAQKGAVTKGELQDYIRANSIEVKEVEKGAPSQLAAFEQRMQAKYGDLWMTGDKLTAEERAQRQRLIDREDGPISAREELDQFERDMAAKYGEEWQMRMTVEEENHRAGLDNQARTEGATKFNRPDLVLPGGENYRELLLTLPEKPMTGKEGPAGWAEVGNARSREGDQNFRSSHWDEPNVLAHIRFNDRTIDGKRTLFIEEIQSDWHQKGKKGGYSKADEPRRATSAEHLAGGNTWRVLDQHGAEITTVYHAPTADEAISIGQSRLAAEPERMRQSGVPDAPFKTTWPELSLKRMIRYAAENGYDQVAWTPGKVQAERYDLSKQIRSVEWLTKPGERDGIIRAFGLDGHMALDRAAKPEELPDIIGKDVAEKLLNAEPLTTAMGKESRNLHGVDLRVGGEGMEGFYDQILPAAANKLGKKYGAKVEQSRMGIPEQPPFAEWAEIVERPEGWMGRPHHFDLVNEDGVIEESFQTRNEAEAALRDHTTAQAPRGESVHTLPITPELREAALSQGFSLFQSQGPRRTQSFPETVAAPIASHKTDQAIKSHPDYTAAKAGDPAAAKRMVEERVDPATIAQARERFGEGAIYAPVVAQEATGHNAIPATLAHYYAEAADGRFDSRIEQANRAYHTGASAMERLAVRPQFEGPVEAGGRYVIVDDVSVMGSTLAEMAAHIRAGGGEVAGVVTLVNASRTGVLRPTKQQLRKIEDRFGDVVRQEFGIEPAALTGDEAQYLLNFRDADALRARSAAALNERNERLRAKGLRPPEAEEGGVAQGGAEGAAGPRGRITFADAKTIIEMFGSADRSTFLHETGHLWLNQLARFAAREGVPQAIKDDLGTVLRWLGVAKAEDIGVNEHEQWARGVEAYLMEGRAPSNALARAFESFKQWLMSIYRSIKDLDVTLTDDIRGVMDRLIATDKQIMERLTDLPPQARADLTHASVASVIEGRPVPAGEMLDAAAKSDTRIAQAWKPEDQAAFREIGARMNEMLGTAEPKASPQAEWQRIARAPRPEDEPDVITASQAAEAMPEPASLNPKMAERLKDAERQAQEAELLWLENSAYVPEDIKAKVSSALHELDLDVKDRSEVLKRGAACLAAAVG